MPIKRSASATPTPPPITSPETPSPKKPKTKAEKGTNSNTSPHKALAPEEKGDLLDEIIAAGIKAVDLDATASKVSCTINDLVVLADDMFCSMG
jgi:hypothetical protein